METSSLLIDLSRNSIIEMVPGLSELAARVGQVKTVSADAQIAQEGSPIEQLIIPIQGSLRLKQENGGTGFLKRYQSLGLKEFLEAQSYSYSAYAEGQCQLFVLPARDVAELLNRQPKVLHYLRLMTSSAGIRSLKNFLSERGVTQGNLFELFATIAPATRSMEAAQSLDSLQGSLVIVKSGKIRLSARQDAGPPFKSEIGEGAWFGGEALVQPHSWSYEATAVTPVTLHVMKLEAARPLLEKWKLIEKFYEEPWIARLAAREKSKLRATGTMTPLPGKALGIEDCRKAGISLNVQEFHLVQSDSESWIASLENLCFVLELNRNLSGLESLLLSRRRITWLGLAEILEPLGVLCSARKVAKREELYECAVPALVRFGPRLAVLLQVKRGEGNAVLLDPARGIIEVSLKDFFENWDAQLLEAKIPRPLAAHGSVGASTVILNCFKRHWRILANVFLLSLLGIGLRMLTPVLSQFVLDEVLSLRDTQTLWAAIAGMILVMLFGVAVLGAKEFSQAEFATRFERDLSSAFYRHALSMPSRFYSAQKTGYILTRIQGVSIIRQFLGGESLDGVIHLLSLVFYIGVLAAYSLKIAGIAVVAALLVFAVQRLFSRGLNRDFSAMFEADSRVQSQIGEQVAAIALIKAIGAEAEMRAKWENSFLKKLRLHQDATLRLSSLQGSIEVLTTLMKIGAIWLGGYLALKGRFSPGELLAISLYLTQMLEPVLKLAHIAAESAKFKVALGKLDDILKLDPEETVKSSKVTHSFVLRGKIRLEKVSFRYNDHSPWVLRDVSLTIYPNQKVAIVGRSGCGKSTLANLIAGNIRPVSGRIFYDDFDGEFLSLHSLRSQIGFIMQGNELFAGTVGENIAYADDCPDDDRIRKAAEQGAAHSFIEALPLQYDYQLAESGLGLSGGEKQRVSIARTLYRNPKILIMDEATSALDAGTERTLLQNLDRLTQGKTSILIAHRLSTVRSADRIVVMQDGMVVEEGTHDALLEKGHHYAELFHRQISPTLEGRGQAPDLVQTH